MVCRRVICWKSRTRRHDGLGRRHPQATHGRQAARNPAPAAGSRLLWADTTLETKNFPFLTKMASALTTNRKSPYTAEVWFVAKSVPLDLKWGTSDPLLIEDPKYHIALPVRAFGQYGFRISDSCRFLARLMGRLPAFTEKTLGAYFRGVIVTRTKDVIASTMTSGSCSLLQIGTKLNLYSSVEVGRAA